MAQILVDDEGFCVGFIDDGFFDGGIDIEIESIEDLEDFQAYLNAYSIKEGKLKRNEERAKLIKQQMEEELKSIINPEEAIKELKEQLSKYTDQITELKSVVDSLKSIINSLIGGKE